MRNAGGSLENGGKWKEGDRWMEIVKNARREGQVWEVVNKEKKKRGVNGGIKMEEWTEYFKELMEE